MHFQSIWPTRAEQAKDQMFPRQVLLLRHAEKPPDEAMAVGLSDQGKLRAEALPNLLVKSNGRPTPFPKPDLIFATKNSKHSHRPLETVTPLAKKLGLPINSDFADADVAQLSDEIFRNPKYAGKTILICWHHGKMPALAASLKATDAPDHFKDTVFDRVWASVIPRLEDD